MAKTKDSNKTHTIVPLGDRVLIQPLDIKGEATTASGFILPGKDAGEKHEKGKILSTGPGRLATDGKRLAMEVSVGDTILFKRGYDTEVVTVDGEELVLMSESNVLAIER
jgi:chaperonin GroES